LYCNLNNVKYNNKIEQEFNEKEFKYKITVEKNGKNIILKYN